MGRVRSRYLRAVVEMVHHETQGAALPRLREGLPPHLARVLSHEVLAVHGNDHGVEADTALEFLVSLDRVLCGGSGVVTTRVATANASRVLSHSAGLVVPGDAVATLQHLRAPFEQPFIDVHVHFSARRTLDGFVLELYMAQHLRAAHWLASTGLGYAKAAARFSGEAASRLRLSTEVTGDVARVQARHADTGVVSIPPSLPPLSGREDRSGRPQRRRPSTTNAAARVDQILGRATPRAGTPLPELKPRGVARASSRPPPPLAKTPPVHESGTRPAVPAPEGAARSRKAGA